MDPRYLLHKDFQIQMQKLIVHLSEKIYANDEEKSALHDVSLWDSLNFWLHEHAKTAKAMQEGAKASLGCI